MIEKNQEILNKGLVAKAPFIKWLNKLLIVCGGYRK